MARADRPERRAAPLPVDGIGGPVKHALEANAADVLATLHEAINDLRDAAAAAKADNRLGLQIEALDVVGRLALRYVELTTGRKMNVNVRVRSQEDLPNYRALPAEVKAVLDAALDAIEAHHAGRVIDMKALPPPAGRS